MARHGATMMGAKAAPLLRNLLAAGDSITAGAGAGAGTGYADAYHGVANPALTWYTNEAASGSTVAGSAPSLQNRATADDALLQAGALNILTVMIGANDLQSLSLATFKANYTSYINDRVAAGWIVVGCTMTATNATLFPSIEADRGNCNTWLISQVGVLLDYVVDFTGTIMDLEATAHNTTYYNTDGIHPKTPGHAILEPVYGVVVDAIMSGLVRTPVITLAAGSYTADQTTTITTTTSGASIYYTLDGSTPTQSSTLYTGAVTIAASETLKAKAFKSGCVASAVASAAYTLTVATPTFSPGAGSYGSAQSVTISSTTSATSIYYTIDGSTPTTSSTLYTGPVSVSTAETIKAIAVKTGCTNSAVGSAAYTFPTFIVATGGTITTDGNYKVHTLTNGQTFTVSSGSGSADYVMAGGGGGGGTVLAGGGSAGEVITGTDTLSTGSYAATVGSGGAGSTARNTPGSDGGDTTWNGHTAHKGRGGGSFSAGAGTSGVNGGGGAYQSGAAGTGSNKAGGAGGPSSTSGGGGGAGQGQVGSPGVNNAGAGKGGDGISSSITGTPTYYGGGGGGGAGGGGGFSGAAGAGGLGGGGAGSHSNAAGSAGTAGLGGGGGGGGYNGSDGAGGAGGTGTVIVRYQFQ